MVLGPKLLLDGVVRLHVDLGYLCDGVDQGVLVISDQVFFGLEPLDIGI